MRMPGVTACATRTPRRPGSGRGGSAGACAGGCTFLDRLALGGAAAPSSGSSVSSSLPSSPRLCLRCTCRSGVRVPSPGVPCRTFFLLLLLVEVGRLSAASSGSSPSTSTSPASVVAGSIGGAGAVGRTTLRRRVNLVSGVGMAAGAGAAAGTGGGAGTAERVARGSRANAACSTPASSSVTYSPVTAYRGFWARSTSAGTARSAPGDAGSSPTAAHTRVREQQGEGGRERGRRDARCRCCIVASHGGAAVPGGRARCAATYSSARAAPAPPNMVAQARTHKTRDVVRLWKWRCGRGRAFAAAAGRCVGVAGCGAAAACLLSH
jgi:hypothetical protein